MFLYSLDNALFSMFSVCLPSVVRIWVFTLYWAVSRPGWNGITSLIEQDISTPSAHFPLRHRLNSTVIVGVPLPVHWVPAVCCSKQRFIIFRMLFTSCSSIYSTLHQGPELFAPWYCYHFKHLHTHAYKYLHCKI